MSVFRRGAHSRRRFCVSRDQRNNPNSYKRSAFSGLKTTDFSRGRGAHKRANDAARVLSKKNYPAFIGAVFAVLLLLIVALPQAYAAIGDAAAREVSEDVLSQNTMQGVSPRGTTINLFDYWLTGESQDNWSWKDLLDAGGADNRRTVQELMTSGINADNTFKFGNGMTDVDGVDEVNYWTGDADPRTDIVTSTLNDEGYPQFASQEIGGSLSYLFDSSEFDGKSAYMDVNGLLQIDDNGYYYYSSKENFAQFNENTKDFTLYNSWGVVSNGASQENGQFFPFDDGTEVFNQTADGEIEPKPIEEISSTSDDLNHYFGMSMSTQFVQQYGGHTSDDGQTDVTYNFSGDDDVWIYIDGVLVGDLGGIHNATSIQINFSTGDIIVYDDKNGDNEYNWSDDGNPISQTTLRTAFNEAGVSTAEFADGNNGTDRDTFADDTYHTLDFFYLERGAVDSNMSLRYNLVNIPESGVVKVDQSGEPLAGVSYTLQQADSNYNIVENGMTVDGVTDDNGEMVFSRENATGEDVAITLEQMSEVGAYWVLTEQQAPTGYRNPSAIKLRFSTVNQNGTGDGVLLASNEWDTGAYSQAHVTASAPALVQEYGNSSATHDLSAENNAGTLFAVVMQHVDTNDDGVADAWYPISGDAFSGWSVESDGADASVKSAAKASGYQFLPGSSGAYETTIENLPGDVTKYEYMLEQTGDENAAQNAEYSVWYYWTDAESLQSMDDSSDIVRVQDDAAGAYQGIGRVFSVTLNVSNIKNELTLHKTNADGSENLQDATYTLYNDVNGDGDYDADTDTVAQVGLTTDVNGELQVYSDAENQILANGSYVLVETSAPSGYQLDETPIQIVVDNDGVHVNAGAADDNVKVETGLGTLVWSMKGFAAGDDVDATLHDVVAQAQVANKYSGAGTSWDTATNEDGSDVTPTHYQYDDQGQDLSYEVATVENNGEATYTADAGWSRLDVQQCLDHEGIGSPKQDLDNENNGSGIENLNALFTGDVTIHVTNSLIPTTGSLRVDKDVTGIGAPEDAEFTYTLNLTDGDQALAGSYTITKYNENDQQVGDTASISDSGTFTLQDGQYVVIDDIPQGASYSLIETEVSNFTPSFSVDSGEVVQGTQAQGIIDSDGSTVVYTNAFRADDVTLSGGSALTVVKNLTANAASQSLVNTEAGAYDFTITAVDTVDSEGATTVSASDAAAKLNVDEDSLTQHFESSELTAVEGQDYVWTGFMTPLSLDFTAGDAGKIFTYEVSEVTPSDAPAYYIYDTNKHTVTYTVSVENGKLTVAVSVDGNPVEDGSPTVTFDNSVTAGTIGGDGTDVQLTVQKSVNVPTEKDFAFDLTLVDDQGAVVESSNAVFEVDGDGNLTSFDGMEMTVSDNFMTSSLTQSAAFGQIVFTSPGTYYFQVSEQIPQDTSGWTYVEDPQTITVKVDDEFNVTVDPEDATISFDNTYAATGELTLSGLSKALEGRDWIDGDEFTFTLTGENVTEGAEVTEGYKLPETTEVTVDYEDAINAASDGSTEGVTVPFSFDEITFSQAGTYRFTIDEGAIDEAGVSNTSGTSVTYEVAVTDETQDGELEVGEPVILFQTGSSVFVNTYDPTSVTANLSGTKALNGASKGLEAGLFTFAVENTAKPDSVEIAPMPSSVVDGVVTNETDGIISFGTLNFDTVGEYVYTISEVAGSQEGMTYDTTTYTVVYNVEDDPENGTLTVMQTVYQGDRETGSKVDAIAFNNTYQPEEVTVPGDTSAGFSGTKTVTDEHGEFGDFKGGEFTFVMANTDVPTGVTAPEPSKGWTATNAADGSFDFGTLTFTEPGTYSYTVSESTADALDGVTYDGTVYTLTYIVEDQNGQLVVTDSSITSSSSSDTEVAADELDFANIYNDGKTDYTISGTKVLDKGGYEGATLEADDFTFVLYEDGEEIGRTTNNADGSFSFDPITYTEAGNHTYTVYELGTDGQPGTGGTDDGNVTYSTEVYTVQVSVTQDETGRGLSVSSDVQNSDIVFTNTYTPESVVVGPNGNAQIGGTKELDAAEGTNRVLKEGEFSFVLLDGDGNEVSTTTNAADGSFLFDDLTFDKAGTYSYTVAEKSGNAGGITYDETLYGVTITVTEDTETNKLVAQIAYSKDNQTVDGITFTNTYEARPISVQLGASKELQNASLAAGQFTFELTGSEGTPMPESTTATNTENGQVLFGEITFDAVGEYDYTITEVNDGQEGITYDADATRTIHVSVTDNGEGFLEATVSYGEDGSHFVNIGTPDEPSDGGDPGDGGNTNGGSSDEGPLESLAQTSDTWLPALFAVIAAMAAAVGGFAAYRMKRSNGRR